jgi:hypothetical protein
MQDRPVTSGWQWIVGEPVRHAVFGTGTVADVTGAWVSVAFDGRPAGPRRFLVDDQKLRSLVLDTSGRVVPSMDNAAHVFVPPLDEGERSLVAWLDAHLGDEWRIYVRPPLPGGPPSAVAVSPERGIAIFDLDRRQGEASSRRASHGARFKEDLVSYAMPALGEWIDRAPAREELVEVVALDTVTLQSDAFRGSVLASLAARSPEFDASFVGPLDEMLGDRFHDARGLESVRLSPEQVRLAVSAPGRHLIRGVAGSGKSIVLAYRAADAARQGKRVILLTYNRTLANYIEHLLHGVPVAHRRRFVTVTHFHGLCRALARAAGVDLPVLPAGAARTRVLEDEWPAAALRACESPGGDGIRYDTVLVDEAQDYNDRFFEVVEHITSGPEELVLAVDEAQDIYERRSTFFPKRRARKGGWETHTLTHAARLPLATSRLASTVAARSGLDTDAADINANAGDVEGPRFNLADPTLAWMSVTSRSRAGIVALELVRSALVTDRLPPAALAVLVPTHQFGSALARLLLEVGIDTNHIFPTVIPGETEADRPTGEEIVEFKRARKKAFGWDDPRPKVCTIQSFKGWEAERVICVLPGHAEEREGPLVYVAATRSRGDLYLVGDQDTLEVGDLVARQPAPAVQSDLERRFEILLAAAAAFTERTTFGARISEDPGTEWEGLGIDSGIHASG